MLKSEEKMVKMKGKTAKKTASLGIRKTVVTVVRKEKSQFNVLLASDSR